MKLVLAALDFSDATPRVVAEAAQLAQAMNGYVVRLHVARVSNEMPHYTTQMAHLPEAVRQVEVAADRQLAEIKDTLRARGVAVQSLRLTGDPKSDIVEQADKLAADYLVVGSHGHSAFHELAVGGVTRAVIKRAKRPVVVVPVTERPRPAG